MTSYAYERTVDEDAIRRMSAEEQREMMESWFRARFENPAERTPYESAEGGYIWIWGGPYDAEQVLRDEFEEFVPEPVIEELAGELSGECSEWAPTPSPDDYDTDLLDVVTSNTDAAPTFAEALGTIRRLLETARDEHTEGALCRLLFANVITAVETYLSDTFINRVLTDDAALRRFVETTPEFAKRNVPYSDIFKAVDEARDDAKRHLLEVVWHNVGKVHAMYRGTLGVELKKGLRAVAAAVETRHHIVHRNGRDRGGVLVVVTAAQLSDLMESAEQLVADVEEQLKPDF